MSGDSGVPRREPAAIAAVLLAGGQSRRMGGIDKSLAALGGSTLIAFVTNRLALQARHLVLNTNGNPMHFAGLGLPIVADPIPDYAGPLAGVLAGLTWAAKEHPDVKWLLSVATDTPFFPDSLADRLLTAVDGTDNRIALARSGERLHPVIGLWDTGLAGALDEWLTGTRQRKVLAFVERHPWTAVDFTETDAAVDNCDPFFNTNTPQDLDLAASLLKGSENHGAGDIRHNGMEELG